MNLIDKYLEIKKKEALDKCPYDFEELEDFIGPEFAEQCNSGDCKKCWEMEVLE